LRLKWCKRKGLDAMMDWKLVSAFAAGAVLASGIVYFAVKPADLVTKPAVIQPAAPRVVAPPPAPEIAVAQPPPAPKVVARVEPPVHRMPVREKPSPMPPPAMPLPARREKPVTVARFDPPPPAATPAPAPVAPPAPVTAPAQAPKVPVQNVSLPASPAPAPKVEVRVPNVVTLAAGMSLAVRVAETISSSRNQPGDTFLATLTQPLVLGGFIIADRGSRLEGRVVEAAQAGRGRSTSHLSISVVRLATSDGQNLRIRTEPYTKDGFSPSSMDTTKVEIPVETRINFRVQDSLTITERLD
jgi:hypothetical protein